MLDGRLTNNRPVFLDRPDRRQIIFDLGIVMYPFALTLSPSDPCIESLVFRGAIEMLLFSTRSTATHGESMLEAASKSGESQPIRFRQKGELAESVPGRVIRSWVASPSAWFWGLVYTGLVAWAVGQLLAAFG